MGKSKTKDIVKETEQYLEFLKKDWNRKITNQMFRMKSIKKQKKNTTKLSFV